MDKQKIKAFLIDTYSKSIIWSEMEKHLDTIVDAVYNTMQENTWMPADIITAFTYWNNSEEARQLYQK